MRVTSCALGNQASVSCFQCRLLGGGEGPLPGPWRSGAVPGGRAFHSHRSAASRVRNCACRPLLRAPACPPRRATPHVDCRGPRARARIPLLEPAVPRTSREAFQLPLPQELFADLARSSSGGGRGFSKQLRGSRVSGVIGCRSWAPAPVLLLPKCPPKCLLFIFFPAPPPRFSLFTTLAFSFLRLSALKFQRPSALDLGPPRGRVSLDSSPPGSRSVPRFPSAACGRGAGGRGKRAPSSSRFCYLFDLQAPRRSSAPRPEHPPWGCAGSLGLCIPQSSRLSVLLFSEPWVEGARSWESGVVGSSVV